MNPPLTKSGKEHVNTLEDAMVAVADFFDHEETLGRIEDAIRRGRAITYEVSIRHHARNGLQVTVGYRTGTAGQIFYLGGLDGPSPDPSAPV